MTLLKPLAVTVLLIAFAGLLLIISRPTQQALPSDIVLHQEVTDAQEAGDSTLKGVGIDSKSTITTDTAAAGSTGEAKAGSAQDFSGQDPSSQPSYRVSREYLSHIRENLLSGGPPKDGIPAIDNAKYLSADEADLSDDAEVFGVVFDDFTAAYPKNIMYWHEIVNEQVNGGKFSVTYCPLTGSVIGYLGKNLGVSGKLYNSNLVFYDRLTDVDYPQILGVGLTGEDAGKPLPTFPVTVTTFGEWKQLHPDTLVLSEDTGFDRDYTRTPYPGYDDALRVWFALSAESDRFHSKELVFGIESGKDSFAVTKTYAKATRKFALNTTMGEITASYDPATDSLSVVDSSGSHVKSFEVYWFAWYAFHPDTKVIE